MRMLLVLGLPFILGSFHLYNSLSEDKVPSIATVGHELTSAFLGIIPTKISLRKAKLLGFENPYGSYVRYIIKNTAAEKADIQPFDYIYGIDEYRVNQKQDLKSILARYLPGDQAAVHLIRKSRKETKQVIFGAYDHVEEPSMVICEDPFLGGGASQESPTNVGVRVEIKKNSSAEAMGMKDGDVILKINDYPMIDWSDIGTAIDNMMVGQMIKVAFLRNELMLYGERPIKSYCQTKLYPEDNTIPAVPYSDQQRLNQKGKPTIVDLDPLGNSEIDRINHKLRIKLAVNNTLNISNLSIVPSRDNDNAFVLTCYLPGKATTCIRIYNDSGRKVYDNAGTFSGKFQDIIHLNHTYQETYNLEIIQGSRAATKKIVLY